MSKSSAGGDAKAEKAASLIEALPFSLLDEPLEYIFADHYRQRSVCAALKRFAEARKVGRVEADNVVAFLTGDLITHHQDEDNDLFPAIRRRAHPEDNLGPILARLSEDHKRSDPMIDEIVATLSKDISSDPIALTSAQAEMMLAYAAHEHRHLVIENGIVLVIARKRLTAADIGKIRNSMKARRGVF